MIDDLAKEYLHLSVTEARYFSGVFDRPSLWPLSHWKSDVVA
ncbi:hypothetical protein ACXJJ3_01285 [Kribbella sp. WER1]